MQGNEAELPDELKPFAQAVQDGYDGRITVIETKQDLSRFTRAHADGPVTWEAHDGPGGTIVLVEHEDD